jgi:hypothetical protein
MTGCERDIVRPDKHGPATVTRTRDQGQQELCGSAVGAAWRCQEQDIFEAITECSFFTTKDQSARSSNLFL